MDPNVPKNAAHLAVESQRFIDRPPFPIPVVGVIGAIGSGKSAVSRWVADRYPVGYLDADRVGHAVLQRTDIIPQLVAVFGPDVQNQTGEIDRSRLAARVFGDTEANRIALRNLEAIVHPAIREELRTQLMASPPPQQVAVLLDAAVLLEAGWAGLCDVIVFVDAAPEIRRKRVQSRGWDAAELLRREASQLPLPEKRAAAALVITNNGDLAESGRALWTFISQPATFPRSPADNTNTAQTHSPPNENFHR